MREQFGQSGIFQKKNSLYQTLTSQRAQIFLEYLSQVRDNNPSQVFVPLSQTTFWPPCFVHLQTWGRHNRPSVLVEHSKQRAKYEVFLRSTESSALLSFLRRYWIEEDLEMGP